MAVKSEMSRVIFTIGRQYGAGGRTVAAEIGRKLGIPVYDNELLTEAAKEFGYSPDIFKKRDEKHHLFGLSRLFSTQAYNAPNYMGDNMLFEMQSKAIQDIATKSSCVIVGRCADYVLRNEKNLVSAFLTASMPVKVERIKKRLEVDEKTARKIIERKESSRKNYYNGYTLGNWGESSSYKICLNTDELDIEACADILIDYARKAGFVE